MSPNLNYFKYSLEIIQKKYISKWVIFNRKTLRFCTSHIFKRKMNAFWRWINRMQHSHSVQILLKTKCRPTIFPKTCTKSQSGRMCFKCAAKPRYIVGHGASPTLLFRLAYNPCSSHFLPNFYLIFTKYGLHAFICAVLR